MTNIKNAESAILMAQARHKSWIEKFMSNWLQPLNDLMFVAAWDAIPQAVKDEMKKSNPEAFEDVEERVRSLGGM